MRAFTTGVSILMFFGAIASLPASGATFEEFGGPPYTLALESYYNGSDSAGGFASGGAYFNNSFIDFGGGFAAWQGWAASNVTDTSTPGYDNQYAAYSQPAGGANGSSFFGVAFSPTTGVAYVDIPGGASPVSVSVTNTTYAALSMRDGDAFAKEFGGVSGDDPDFFKLLIQGQDSAGAPVGLVEFYLADYRFADNGLDYIVGEWTNIDLTPLAGARRLLIGFESSDLGPFGINTPTYAAFDNLVWVPEPGALAVLLTVAAMQRRRG